MSDEVDESIARARRHVGNATREAFAALEAILEAGGRASGLDPGQIERLAAGVAQRLEAPLGRLREGALSPSALARPLDEALAREIARWEARSQHDPDARAVLRAFLGLRELLFELGMRGDTEADSGSSAPAPAADRTTDRAAFRPSSPQAPDGADPRPPPRPRVQRFDVEG